MARRDRLVEEYARALLAVAEAEGELADVEEELYRFGKAVEREPGLRDALTDPGLPTDRKRAVVEELLSRKASRHTRNLVAFLIEQGRARDLPRIVEALAELAAERRRRVVAEVRSAVPLDDERRERLARALSRATGKDVEVRVLVDPSVIGGVVARVGDQVFDGSIRNRLQQARERLAGVGRR
ncbi:MAG TPA: ATP synthase F1 subunit delta [Actinomycetota bacterium]|nr:ATP synthase F1 subunit delta [Actinomycetota bacterium]